MLLWQMIVGELPGPENQAVMMKSHLDAPRRYPRQVNPRIRLPDAPEVLMTRLIARHPADRPVSAYAVRAPSCRHTRRPGSASGGSDVPLSDKPLTFVPLPNFGPGWMRPAVRRTKRRRDRSRTRRRCGRKVRSP